MKSLRRQRAAQYLSNQQQYLSAGIDIPYILGEVTGGAGVPVNVTVGITPELNKTVINGVLGAAGIIATAVIVGRLISNK